MIRTVVIALACFCPLWSSCAAGDAPTEWQWFKGNTHTHTLWSDGDAAPEVAAAWYRDHGYDFLVLSDHNILSEGETRSFVVHEYEEDRYRIDLGLVPVAGGDGAAPAGSRAKKAVKKSAAKSKRGGRKRSTAKRSPKRN